MEQFWKTFERYDAYFLSAEYLMTATAKDYEKQTGIREDAKLDFEWASGLVNKLQKIKSVSSKRKEVRSSVTRDRMLYDFCMDQDIEPCPLLLYLIQWPVDLADMHQV